MMAPEMRGDAPQRSPVFISDGVNKDRYNTVEVSGLRYWDACAETKGDKMLTLIGEDVFYACSVTGWRGAF